MTGAAKLRAMKWRKILAPVLWHPADGEELTGFYAGRTKRDGKFGQYEVLVVLVPYKGGYMVSGTSVIQLADSAMLSRGDAVRIKYLGKKPIAGDREMKQFELFVGETERADDIPAEELPS